MKRYGNLYSQIVDFENILIAAQKAQRGKRFRENVLAFNDNCCPTLPNSCAYSLPSQKLPKSP